VTSAITREWLLIEAETVGNDAVDVLLRVSADPGKEPGFTRRAYVLDSKVDSNAFGNQGGRTGQGNAVTCGGECRPSACDQRNHQSAPSSNQRPSQRHVSHDTPPTGELAVGTTTEWLAQRQRLLCWEKDLASCLNCGGQPGVESRLPDHSRQVCDACVSGPASGAPQDRSVSRSWYLKLGVGAVALQALVVVWYAAVHGIQNPIVLAHLGTEWSRPFGLTSAATGVAGYDGQFYYYMARFPGHLAMTFDLPALRYSRVLYPALAAAVSVGQSALVPWMLVAVNVVAIAATTVLLANILERRGLPPLLALVALVYCGQLLAVLHDLADPLAVLFMVAALWSVQRSRWTLAGVCCALGCLTRETDVVIVAAVVIPLLLERRWSIAGRVAAVALIPFALWHGFLYAWLGDAGLSEAIHATFVPPTNALVAMIVIFGVIPVAVTLAFAVRALLQRERALITPALCAVFLGLLYFLQPADHWPIVWGSFRVAAPVVVLMPLLIKRPMVSWRLLLLAASSSIVILPFAGS